MELLLYRCKKGVEVDVEEAEEVGLEIGGHGLSSH
jgi:riboflavin synthase alpha subunit